MLGIVYGICAAVAGTILACQLLLSLLGIGGEHEVGDDLAHAAPADGHGVHHDGNAFLDVLSFRTVVAALAFFGLAGLGGERSGWSAPTTLVVALAAGAIALYAVYWLGAGLSRLQADATARPSGAIGCSGSVYLRVPAGRSGVGKVQISQQGRTIEYQAVTGGAELPVGRSVVVVALVGADTLEVESES